MKAGRFFCYIHGDKNSWEAICPALDIAVQGESFDEVRRILSESLNSYIEDALAENPETARRLLARKSPLHVRLGLAFRFLRHIIDGGRDREFTAGLDIPCRA